ncbi:MAG: hypothetical protein LBF63_01075, partial [Treponema sp.]|nr:hypothetical protein [Treponema sp.]
MRKLSFSVILLAVCALSLAAQEVPGTSASTMSDIKLLNVGAYVSSLGAGKVIDGRTIVPVKYEDPL